ncbi:uncharacterized protein [Nicotiana sylvestris]|uniref:Retrotransposon gag domain-containing protein n=1 Tax=Nicotiana tabacum TaxID=4097 RepID=A0A1S3YU79_TOBAC|nr:PREDICTED: uncharacterized protein LOC107779716 [Nicotiana tabacum]
MTFRKCDVSCKDATAAVSAELSHIGPITRSKFRASGLDGTEYFASLEPSSNLGEFEDLVDSPISTMVNALMTDTTNVDEKFAMMEQTIEVLKKSVEDKDLQIAQLMNKLEAYAPEESSHVPPRSSVFTSPKTAIEESLAKFNIQKEKQSTLVAALSVQQLQDMITNTIRSQYGEPSQSSLYYSKPYTKRIDCLTMPTNYQPSKPHQFDGKGNLRKHIAHFVETCSNAGTHGDLLVKQFVRSLKGNAFDWYIDLEPESIDNWEQLEKEFLNRFYSTRRTVSMIELTGTKQRQDEPVVDYINRWRALSLDCKDRLSEISAVEMCIQGMHWGLLYIL